MREAGRMEVSTPITDVSCDSTFAAVDLSIKECEVHHCQAADDKHACRGELSVDGGLCNSKECWDRLGQRARVDRHCASGSRCASETFAAW